MSNPENHIVDCASVGEPINQNLVQTVRFIIYDFKDRNEKQGEFILSPVLKAHGFDWRIRVHPRGTSGNNGWVLLSLCICDVIDIYARFWFPSKQFSSLRRSERMTSKDFVFGTRRDRDYILKYCLEENGSFVIDAQIEITRIRRCVWYPQKPLKQNILKDLYHDASSDTADVVFSVEEKVYAAHKNILALHGNKLYEIANECDVKNEQSIPIPSVRGEVFKMLLDSVYNVNQPPTINNEEFGTELLVAADRYDFQYLKLYAESVLVDKFLTATSAASLLIFADSHSCALLKEAAMNLFLTQADVVKQGEAWSQVRESTKLLEELLDLVSSSRKRDRDDDENDVASLRKKLKGFGLELDGSREVLVNRLKAHSQSQAMEG